MENLSADVETVFSVHAKVLKGSPFICSELWAGTRGDMFPVCVCVFVLML